MDHMETDVRDFAALRARIVERYPEMSKQLKIIAEFALQNPEVMAMETVARLSERIKLPPSTFIRFAQALDYSGFSEMKRDFSNSLIFSMKDRDRAEPEADIDDDIISSVVRTGTEELNILNSTLDRGAFKKAVTAIVDADSIFVTAQHLSYPLAALFAWSLLQEEIECILLDNVGGFALRQSESADAKDVTVAISFAPYQPSVIQQAHAHSERGGTVIGITDSEVSPLANAATHNLILQGFVSGKRGTVAGATCLIRALTRSVANAKNERSDDDKGRP